MMNESNKLPRPTNVPDEELSLQHLISFLWGSKKTISIFIMTFFVISLFYALMQPVIYRSDTILRAADSSNSASIKGLQGLAAYTGMAIPSSGVSKSEIAVQTIKSRYFLKHLLTFDDVMPSLMAIKYFDNKKKLIVFDERQYNVDSKQWVGGKPSYLEAYKHYVRGLSVGISQKDGFINLSFEHESPIFSNHILELIVREINELMRAEDLRESADALLYLKSEISETQLVEIRSSISKLIEQQLSTQMLAKINTDYALKVLEPSYVPEEKYKPNRRVTVFIGTILGFILGVLWVSIPHYYLNDEH